MITVTTRSFKKGRHHCAFCVFWRATEVNLRFWEI
jgi:hypothetical protein